MSENTAQKPLELVDAIIALESGELDPVATCELFAKLITSGLAWQLQGAYGRTASNLIARGIITRGSNGIATVDYEALDSILG